MVVAIAVALSLVSCPSQYEQIGAAEIRFPVGSAELPSAQRERLFEVLAPLAGDPLAEVEFTVYFPYRSDGTPAHTLAWSRYHELRSMAGEAGVSTDLVGGSISATGLTFDGYEPRVVPYPVDRLDLVDIKFRIKAECHPLTDLARRTHAHHNKQ